MHPHPYIQWQIAKIARREMIAEGARQRLIADARAEERRIRIGRTITLRLWIAARLIRSGERLQGAAPPRPPTSRSDCSPA